MYRSSTPAAFAVDAQHARPLQRKMSNGAELPRLVQSSTGPLPYLTPISLPTYDTSA